MPQLNGIDATRAIRESCPDDRTIALTMYAEDQYVLAPSMPASEVTCSSLRRRLTSCARFAKSAAARSTFPRRLPRGRGRIPGPQIAPEGSTSAAGREVLQLVAEGKTTKEIAQVLGVGAKTAESHRTRIMRKLEIHDTAGLVRYAIRQGVIQA